MRKAKWGLLAGAALAVGLSSFAAAAKDYRVAVIRWDPNDIYFNGVQLGQEQERRRIETETGDKIEFSVFGANDVTKQRNALDAQIARGVDGVLLVPWRGEAMVKVVNDLYEQGIPVVVSNAYVPKAKETFVAFDNETAGRKGGEAIVAWLDKNRGQDWRSKDGVIVELRCIITASFDIGRHNGYQSVFAPIVEQHPNIKVEVREAGCDGSKARKAVDDLIARYGKEQILAVASIDGTMGIGGAIPAFAAQGMLAKSSDPNHIPVATIDGTKPELEAVERGDLTHVSVQPATGEGIVSMRLLYDMMKSGKLLTKSAEKGTYDVGSQELWTPVEVIPSDEFDGDWYKTQAYSIPGDVPPNDPRNWAIQMEATPEGKAASEGG
ncbi:MAG TPA: sugar ABC transporter substrate-binding protein [Geminicoccus sp.]|jgi:ribose transport system substrate-binding protein|uniref:sugar ABC transporter substrate-binding protein n=1 Tax=Geminicoccus sp. TaxID=2024832 RepID=UPI002E37EC4D|nr:sugar ABC transporter substrate-binding protein [Geminicoccus sp.]HEX2529010.1 sugar ABC transporter substrate-binding protein [Geminicoccus sp.]